MMGGERKSNVTAEGFKRRGLDNRRCDHQKRKMVKMGIGFTATAASHCIGGG